MTDTHEQVDARPPHIDGAHERGEHGTGVTTESDASPLVRAVATRLRIALRSDSARQPLEMLPAEVELRSASDMQCARLTRTPAGVHVDTPDGPVAATVLVDPVSLTVSADVSTPGLPEVGALALLLDPEPPSLVTAAREFWETASGLRGMPGLMLVAMDTGDVVRVGPESGAYEIHGSERDLRRLMAGIDWFVHAVREGKFYISGSHRQLSVVAGASMKVVYHV